MSIATALTNLEAARAGIVTAVNAKGGTLDTGATLWQAKAGIEGIETGGGATEYYKCASVDTATKTWSGYKVLLGSDGYYTIDTQIQNLSYTGITPQIGGTYSSDTRVKTDLVNWQISETDLLFFAPLGTLAIPSVGDLTNYGSFGAGKWSVLCNTGDRLTSTVTMPNTFSFGVCAKAMTTLGTYAQALWIGTSSGSNVVNISRAGSGKMSINVWERGSIENTVELDENEHIYIGTYDNGLLSFYVDGVFIASSNINVTPTSSVIIGQSDSNGSDRQWRGTLRNAFVYSRALTANDISQLSQWLMQ